MIGGVKTYLRIVLVVKSWVKLIIFWAGLKDKISVKFRNGQELTLTKDSWDYFMGCVNLFRAMPEAKIFGDKVQFPYAGKNLVFVFKQFGPDFVSEIFGRNEYGKLLGDFSLKNRVVVDIGAAFGDTPIYFAVMGAKKVYAYEPLPSHYAIAKENIRLNNLEDVCEIINGGVGAKNGSFIDNEKNEALFAGFYKELEANREIPVISLDHVIRQFGLENAVIKSDCEGYEYEIFLNASRETLRHFDLIVMEYHYGFERLEGKFKECGFEVRHTPPQDFYNSSEEGGHKKMSLGFLRAEKIIDKNHDGGK